MRRGVTSVSLSGAIGRSNHRGRSTLTGFATLLAVCLAILPAAPPALAHFLLNFNLRQIHVEALADGFRVFIRLPMPMVVATPAHARNPDDPTLVAPYTFNRVASGRLLHYVDGAKLLAAPAGLGRLVAGGHHFVVDRQRFPGEVEAVRVHDATGVRAPVPLFNSLNEAKLALSGPVYPPGTTETLVGDALVDVAIFYPHAGPKDSFEFSSSLATELPGTDLTENLLRFYRADGTVSVYRARGPLTAPIVGGASPLALGATYVYQGVRHILEGADHVLFVLCLTLGAPTIRRLVSLATGFTIGHSATLVAGFLGYAPRVSWFVPAVETGIALSIIYVAAVSLFRMRSNNLLATAAVGLLHGFGFSFVLSQILKLDSGSLALSLISFNVGIEIGQLGIILLVWPALRWLDRRSPRLSARVRATVASGSVAVALVWVGTRSVALLHSI